MSAAGVCVVCGAAGLVAHLQVAGRPGAEGLIPTTDRYGVALSDIVACRACSHMQLARMPAAGELEPAVAGAFSEDLLREAAGQRATARRLLAGIEAELAPDVRERGARLLDLGCWLGFLLDEARSRGWAVTGVEPSRQAAAHARDALGLDVHTAGVLDAELPLRAFDAVVMGDVIEHLPDPGAALDRIAGWIAPGGLLGLALPDAGSRVARLLGRRWWSVLPTHVQYFTRESLLRLLRGRGWDPVSVGTAPKAFSVEYYLTRVAGYWPLLARAGSASARRAGIAERIWAPDFRDRMAVLARAPSAPALQDDGPGPDAAGG